jgi:hypothetical protein
MTFPVRGFGLGAVITGAPRILMADQDRVAAIPSGEGRSVKALAERGLSLVQGAN